MSPVKGWQHFVTITHHRHLVRKGCFAVGLYWQGLTHDLSKYSPTEFKVGAKYFQGNRSPIGVCRRQTGISRAWLHHKGRNKHHIEYWTDFDLPENPVMPYKSAVECICDKLAATKTYNGKNYTTDKAIEHWHRYGNKVPGNPKTMRFIETVFTDLSLHGEKYILNKKYMKDTYKRICIDEN